MALFAAQHGMVWVNLDLLPRSGEDGDLRTAEHLGRRIAEVAARLSAEPVAA